MDISAGSANHFGHLINLSAESVQILAEILLSIEHELRRVSKLLGLRSNITKLGQD